MGFPVGYTELLLPKLLLHTLSVLGFIRNLISAIFQSIGFGDFLNPEVTWTNNNRSDDQFPPEPHKSLSAALIRELLPVVRFSDLEHPPAAESCAVCLYEFDRCDEIRQLTNCRHIFHRGCLDRWMDHDQRTCPLCRTQFVPDDMQESFNERLWAATGVSDFYGEYSPVAAGL